MYVLWFLVFIVFLVMFYYFNCVVLLLLFVVWLFVSVIGVNAAPSRDSLLVLQYGGVLGRKIPAFSDKEVHNILQVIYDCLKEAPHYSVVLHGNGSVVIPQLTRLDKIQHLVTMDNRHPLVVVYNDRRSRQRTRAHLVLSLAYTVSITWSGQFTNDVYNHHFALSYDTRFKMFHTFSHTYSARSLSLNDSVFPSELLSMCGPPQPFPFIKVGGAVAKPLVINLKLLSYNVWNTNQLEGETYDDRMERMRKLLSNSEADIIALQEVRYDNTVVSSQGNSQISHLYQHLKEYQYVFQPAMSYGIREYIRVEEGVAVLSKYPIISHNYILLYRNSYNYDDDYHQRICLHVEIAVPIIGSLHVFVTHLSLNAVSRLRSVVEIWNFMSRYHGSKVLMGDMNTEPNSHTIRFLKGSLSVNGVYTENLKDAWDYVNDHVSSSGLTFSTLDDQLTKRIDYIFTYLLPTNTIQWVGLLDDKLRQSEATSDHIGVMVQLKLTR